MAHLRIRIEEMEYRPEDKSLFVLGVDDFSQIVTLEVRPVYPRQMAADLDFVARHPNARVLVGDAETPPPTPGNDVASAAVDPSRPQKPES